MDVTKAVLRSRRYWISSRGTAGAAIFLVGFAASIPGFAEAQTFEPPGESRASQEYLSAGPFSKVNLATGTLATRVPLIDLPSFRGLRLSFALIHNSGVDVKQTNRSAAKNWLHTGHEYLYSEYQYPITNSPADRGYSIWTHVDDGALAGSWYTKTGCYQKEYPGFATRDYYNDDTHKLSAYEGSCYTLFKHKAESHKFGDYADHFSTLHLVTEQNNGLGPGGKGDKILYSYKDNRLVRITETTRAGKSLRNIVINYRKGKDAIESIDLNYNEGGIPKKLSWSLDTIDGKMMNLWGPYNAINPQKHAQFSYVASDCKRISGEVDEAGGVWSYDYYTSGSYKGRLKEIRPPNPSTGLSVPVGSGIKLEYSGDTTKVTDQLLRQTVYTHSGAGYKTIRRIDYPAYQPIGPGGTAVGNPVMSYETFTWNQDVIAQHQDRLKNTTTYTYWTKDDRLVLRYLDTPGGRTEYTFDANRNLFTRITDPLGTNCDYSYNSFKQVTAKQIVAADTTIGYSGPALVHTWTYDPSGRLTDDKEGSDPATHYSDFDDYGRPHTAQNPWGKTASMEFDGLGNKTIDTPPAPQLPSSNQYDSLGTIWKSTSPAGTTRQMFRLSSTSGVISASKDLRGYVTKTMSDYLGRPCFVHRFSKAVGGDSMDPVETQAESAKDIETQVVYDPVGNPIQEVSAKGEKTYHSYDALNRRVRTLYPDGKERVWQYDEAGNVVKSYDGRGLLTTVTFDWANRPLTTTYGTGSNLSNVTCHYRADGLMDAMTDGTGTTTYTFSKAKQVVKCYQPATNATVTYLYDEAGRKTRVSVGSQSWVYNYVSGRLDSISASLGNSTPASYTYYDDGSIDTIVYGNGFKTKYGYTDGSGRTTDISFVNPQNATLRHLSYGYGGSENLTSVTDEVTGASPALTTNSYDFANRIVSESRSGGSMAPYTFAYAYDKAGNRISTTRNGIDSLYTTDVNDRFVSGDGWGMPLGSYDGNGNPQKITGPNNIDWTLTYNAVNQLSKVVAANGATDSFKYNGAGTRIELVRPSGTSRYILDGKAILAITDGANNIVEYCLNGIGSVFPATSAGSAATNVYDETDLLGSTLDTRNGAGVVIRADNYDAFGNTERVTDGPLRTGRYGGTHGYVSDQDTGFNLCGARYYVPAIGRFLTQDPTGHQGGLNLYAYCNNNPMGSLDPEGTNAYIVYWGGGLGFGSHVGIAVDVPGRKYPAFFDFGPATDAGPLFYYNGNSVEGDVAEPHPFNIRDVNHIPSHPNEPPDEVVMVKTTPEQDRRMLSWLKSMVNDAKDRTAYGEYNGFTRQCSSFVADALRKGGLADLRMFPYNTPSQMWQWAFRRPGSWWYQYDKKGALINFMPTEPKYWGR